MQTTCPSKLEAEVYALQRAEARRTRARRIEANAEIRKSLDGTGWLRLFRAVADQDEIKLAELLDAAERAFMKAVLAGEVHRDAQWSSWYVQHMIGGMS